MLMTNAVVNFANISAILRAESTIEGGGEKSVWGKWRYVERLTNRKGEGRNRRGN